MIATVTRMARVLRSNTFTTLFPVSGRPGIAYLGGSQALDTEVTWLPCSPDIEDKLSILLRDSLIRRARGLVFGQYDEWSLDVSHLISISAARAAARGWRQTGFRSADAGEGARAMMAHSRPLRHFGLFGAIVN